MKKIDDIFKKGLDHKGLEYSDAHWDSMSTLLGSKKAGFFVRNKKALLGFFLIVTVGIVGVYLGIGTSNINDHNIVKLENASTELVAESDKNNILNQDSILEHMVFDFSGFVQPSPFVLQDPGYFEYPPTYPHNNYPLGHNPSYFNFQSPIVGKLSLLNQEINLSSKLNVDVLDKSNLRKGKAANRIRHAHSKLRVSIAPYTEYSIYKRQLDESINLSWKNEENINNSLGYGVDFFVGMKNFKLKTGVGILKLKEVNNYTSEEDIWNTTSTLKIVNQNYDTTPRGRPVVLIKEVIDSTHMGTQEVVLNPETEVVFTYFNIPLSLQYEFTRNRLVYFGQVGANYTILKSASGRYNMLEDYYTDSNGTQHVLNNYVDLANNSSEISKSMLFLHANAGLRYRITSKVDAWVSYGFSKTTQSMFTNYQQKPSVQSLRFGMQYRILN
jgi:hypothetical protein